MGWHSRLRPVERDDGVVRGTERPSGRRGTLPDGSGFYVADDGAGFDPDVREDLFETGVTGGSGTGLGLAIVDRIASAHGWTVTATDGEDGGARFEFRGVDARIDVDDTGRPSTEPQA